MADDQIIIQGNVANVPEAHICYALDAMHIVYEFQFRLWGAMGIRGSILIDWVCYVPRPTPLEYFGDYWHEGLMAADDVMRLSRIAKYFGVARDKIAIYGSEIDAETDKGTIMSILREKLGAGA